MRNTVKVARARKDVTQAKLAELVKVSRQTIVALENNKISPSTLLSKKIGSVLDTSVDELFVLEESDWQ